MDDVDVTVDAPVDAPGEASGEAPREPDHPNLLRPSMFALGWWISVVAGLSLVAVAVWFTLPNLGDADPAFWMIAGLLFLFEFFPVIIGSGYDSRGSRHQRRLRLCRAVPVWSVASHHPHVGRDADLRGGEAKGALEGAVQHRQLPERGAGGTHHGVWRAAHG